MKKIICLMCNCNCFIEQLPHLQIIRQTRRHDNCRTVSRHGVRERYISRNTANFGNLPWREVFTDPQLQTLIEQALTNNGDLRSAALNVKQAQAALMSARLAYAPMLALSPQGNRQQLGQGKGYTNLLLPVTASWQSRPLRSTAEPEATSKKVSLKQTQFYEQAVQTQVIAGVANMYYTLLMLDRQPANHRRHRRDSEKEPWRPCKP